MIRSQETWKAQKLCSEISACLSVRWGQSTWCWPHLHLWYWLKSWGPRCMCGRWPDCSQSARYVYGIYITQIRPEQLPACLSPWQSGRHNLLRSATWGVVVSPALVSTEVDRSPGSSLSCPCATFALRIQEASFHCCFSSAGSGTQSLARATQTLSLITTPRPQPCPFYSLITLCCTVAKTDWSWRGLEGKDGYWSQWIEFDTPRNVARCRVLHPTFNLKRPNLPYTHPAFFQTTVLSCSRIRLKNNMWQEAL